MLMHPSHLFFIISTSPLPLNRRRRTQTFATAPLASECRVSQTPLLACALPSNAPQPCNSTKVSNDPIPPLPSLPLPSPPLPPPSHSSFVCLSFSQFSFFSTLPDIFETMYFASLEASMELAKVEGPYSTYEGSPMSRGVIQPGQLTSEDRSSSTFFLYYSFLHQSIPFPSLQTQ